MKVSRFIILFFACAFFYTGVASQNVSINVLTQNSGIVRKGNTVFFEVTINNTDPSGFIGVYKLKTQVSVPDSIVSIQKSGHSLPTGWDVISNNGSTITLSNGKDMIAANDSRTLLIAINGDKPGGALLLSGQLSFSNGIAPGIAPGLLNGDNPADNFSTSSCKVIK